LIILYVKSYISFSNTIKRGKNRIDEHISVYLNVSPNNMNKIIGINLYIFVVMKVIVAVTNANNTHFSTLFTLLLDEINVCLTVLDGFNFQSIDPQ